MRYLTIALAKGRLAKKAMELFEAIGISCDEMKDKDSRKLIFVNEELGIRFFLAKANDVPTYVDFCFYCTSHKVIGDPCHFSCIPVST